MNFECLLFEAKYGNKDAKEKIIYMYRPLLIKIAMIDGTFDEDLYQELSLTLLKCIDKFHM